MFEFLNKVLLRGVVGTASVQDVLCKKHVHFSVVTEKASMGPDGQFMVETFWISVSAFEGKAIPAEEILKIKKGAKVEVVGRLRSVRYTGEDGTARIHVEALASQLHVIEDVDDSTSILPDIK